VYLDCGGNYDGAAANLVIHRSTLQRIRQITEMELNDVDIRLNLHVATRAWGILSGDAPSSP
jgi:DNA-binding PucR family transcriptional regulator